MWSRCGGVIGAMRHASAMHPIVTFRMRTRCERWRMLNGTSVVSRGYIVSYHTLYILCIYPVILILVFYWSLISRSSLGHRSVECTILTTNNQQKPPPLGMVAVGKYNGYGLSCLFLQIHIESGAFFRRLKSDTTTRSFYYSL